MIEMLVLSMILAKVVQNGVVDIAFAMRGKPSPRLEARGTKRPKGAAYSYFSDLWNDSWDDASAKRRARREGTAVGKSRGAAGAYFANRWRAAWERADEKHANRPPRRSLRSGLAWRMMLIRMASGRAHNWFRRAVAPLVNRWDERSRPRPDQETVPGEVVPNVEDGDGDEPHVVPTEDGRTDLQFGDDPTDPTGTKTCPECKGGLVLVDGEICSSCKFRQKRRDEHWDAQQMRDDIDHHSTETIGDLNRRAEQYYQDHPEERPLPDSTQEGPTMTTTIPTDTEVIGLDPAISYCDTTVQACTAMQHSLEHTEAAIAAGGVTGVASAAFAQAKELFGQIATVMQGAGQEFSAHKAIQEAYDANPGAGTREFVTGGR